MSWSAWAATGLGAAALLLMAIDVRELGAIALWLLFFALFLGVFALFLGVEALVRRFKKRKRKGLG